MSVPSRDLPGPRCAGELPEIEGAVEAWREPQLALQLLVQRQGAGFIEWLQMLG